MSSAAAKMDDMYRRQRHIYDASRKFYLLGRDGLIRQLQPPHGGSILEIGCGTARNLIDAALEYPAAHCYGVDISQEMLASARASLARIDGLSERVSLAQGDAAGFDPQRLFGVGRFDRIMIPYALSMIPCWREALAHAASLLSPCGSLHIVDFGDFEGLPGWFAEAMRRWLAAFSVTPRAGIRDEIDALAAKLQSRAHVQPLFRGYAVNAVICAPRVRMPFETYSSGSLRTAKDALAHGRSQSVL